ncbi:MAG TPA: glycosyltransferase family 9 protein [Burkholderiales bacterium]|nr:glycosyltransferase family 9 protein [Burkholderiales bacterium]
MSRLATRLHVLPRALLRGGARRARPSEVRRILVVHHLLLGDTLMLTALLARLRRLHPRATIDFTVAPAFLPLYAQRPYGVDALPFDPRQPGLTRALTRRGPYDLALVPGDNRFCLLARAAGARWIVALEGDAPGWKNRVADALLPWPRTPANLADMFASLAGAGDDSYAPANWPAPPCAPLEPPATPYAVLHVGAGSVLRHWPAERWMALAQHLEARGLTPVWSAGPQEMQLVESIDPQQRYPSLAGRLDLAQLWHLLAGARLLVVPDTGIAHLAKLTATPTVCLYGPGSDVLFGAGRFWRDHRFAAAIVADFPCRDQKTLFKRELEWVRRCQRGTDRCAAPACMHALELDHVFAACAQVLDGGI